MTHHFVGLSPARQVRARQLELELGLDRRADRRQARRSAVVSKAARELGLRRAELARAPILAKARELRAELGLPEHPMLESPSRRNPSGMKADSSLDRNHLQPSERL